MRWNWVRTWAFFAMTIIVVSASAHAPLRWFRGVAGGYKAHLDVADESQDRWIYTNVEGPEIEGTLFGWHRVSGGRSVDEEVRAVVAQIDAMIPGPGVARTWSRVESMGPAVTSTLFVPMTQAMVMDAKAVHTGATLVGSGLTYGAPEVSRLVGSGLTRASTEPGFSSDPSLRLGSPYTGVASAITHRPPLIGGGTGGGTVGGGGGVGSVPSVGGSVPEPGILGSISLFLILAGRRPRRK